jgi:phage gpG-like protein
VISAVLAGDGAVLDRLRQIPEAARAGVARAVAQLGIDLQNNVQQNKLSGGVLRARSGALRESIMVQVDQGGTAATATVSSNLNYAAVHEFGFAGTVSIPAGLRQIKEAFGRPIATKAISVRAYSRRIDLPERSFLRSALDDMTPDISAGIEDALREAIS